MYNIVAGPKRGGTSMLMLALRQAGVPVLGYKNPIRLQREKKTPVDAGLLYPLDEKSDNNPYGFWEIPSICEKYGLRKIHKDVGFEGDVVKVMSSILPLSDPEMVSKAIVTMRDPRKIISSREKCDKEMGDEFRNISYIMLIHNTVLTMRWLEAHEKPYYMVTYEEMLDNPKKHMKRICRLFRKGSYKIGAEVITSELDRSPRNEKDSPEAKQADEFYELFKNKDKNKILLYDINKIEDRIKKLNTGVFDQNKRK